jgi:hypothetical protein
VPVGEAKRNKRMGVRVTRKRVLILSDSEPLARAVELNLGSYPEIECIKRTHGPSLGSRGQPVVGRPDLVVLAVGLLTTEPIAMLDEMLPAWERRAPLLLISNEPPRADWGGAIYRLGFPFDAGEFHRQVKRIFREAERTRSVAEERVGPQRS